MAAPDRAAGHGSRSPEGAARLPQPDPAPSPGAPPASSERFAPNICCVGDDDQSIYGWRGAEVDNILRFEHDFPGAKVIRLERNYRSTGHILATASHLIAHNEGRLGKTLRTEDEPGEKVTVTGSWDSEEEARAVGEEIEQLQRAGHPLNEIAILVRASFQMREFEDRFVTLGLPYRVIGGPRFYERAESAMRSPICAWSIRRPTTSLRTYRQRPPARPRRRDPAMPARARARQAHPHRSGAGDRRDRRAQGEAARGAARPHRGARPLARPARRPAPYRVGRDRARRVGYTDMWQRDRSADAAGRLENLKELVRSMEEFENLQGFLEHISLVMEREPGGGRRCGLGHDAALRQGAGIRHGIPHRLGGRPVSPPARARRAGPPGSRRSAGLPMWG